MMISKLRRTVGKVLLAVFLLAAISNAVMPSVQAISESALKSILNNTPFYDPSDNTQSCNDATAEVGLTGSDNIQKGYNYFFGKGLSDFQSAAIIGNFMQESGMNPNADQAGGPGLGIAQWSNPGRWNNLEKFATNGSLNPKDLGTQLEFVWAELSGTPPAGDYSGSLAALKAETTIDGAVTAFEENYERAGDPQMANRISFAKRVLQKYGSGDTTTTTTSVSGTNASCGSTGAVDCANITTSTSTLSQTRQNVVCLAQAELVKWDKGELKPGSDFMTHYSQARNEEWCADFTSYIFNQAGYPLKAGNDGNVPAVDSVIDIGKTGGKFAYHEADGYTPIPGDMVIYKLGWSHINIVVSVNQNDSSMEVIGGNQNGTSTANTSSRVSQYNVKGFGQSSVTHVIGYVSPER